VDHPVSILKRDTAPYLRLCTDSRTDSVLLTDYGDAKRTSVKREVVMMDDMRKLSLEEAISTPY